VPLGIDTNSQLVLNIIKLKQTESSGFLGLLQIASGDELMELVFDEPISGPVRIALVMSTVPYEPLVELFSSFHKNDVVRNNTGIAACVFGSESYEYFASPKYILDPLPIVWENTDELEDLFDR